MNGKRPGRRGLRVKTRGLLRAATVAVSLSVSVVCASFAADSELSDGTLWLGAWRVEAFGERAFGFWCWIAGDDAALRVELIRWPDARDAPAANQWTTAFSELKQRQGEGWTYTRAAAEAPGLFQRWGRRWRQVSPDLAALLSELAAALERGPSAPGWDFPASQPRPDPTPTAASDWRARSPDRRGVAPKLWHVTGEFRIEDPEAANQPSATAAARWRRDLIARGQGRGGRCEIVTLRWQDGGVSPERAELVVRSRRRVATLYLWPLTSEPVRYPVRETFLPLWPLAQLLGF
jgi:hypothetical protein